MIAYRPKTAAPASAAARYDGCASDEGLSPAAARERAEQAFGDVGEARRSVLTLAIAIGGATVFFSVVDGVLLKALPIALLLAASYVPARRATRGDPMEVPRSE